MLLLLLVPLMLLLLLLSLLVPSPSFASSRHLQITPLLCDLLILAPSLVTVAKQAKLLGQKLKIDQATEVDGDEKEDSDEDGGKDAAGNWGKKKRDYYNADNNEYEVYMSPISLCS